MKLFEGKSPTERNKIIAAIALGVTALLALTYTFSGMFVSSPKTTVTVTASPTPTVSPKTGDTQNTTLPTDEDLLFGYTTTPVFYNQDKFYAPEAGRNIFAFYEPPPYIAPLPVEKTPPPYIPPPTPTPTPVPPLLVGFMTPQSVFAGSKGFRLEVNGDKFTPDSAIYFNGNPLPTNYLSPQKLTADIPSNFIAGEGIIYILVRTPNGKLYSNQVSLTVQAPPTPQLQYIGMIARKRYNNDTAYFQEKGKENEKPFGARLNDVVSGRFRLTSISAEEVVLEDVSLGFRHKVALYRVVAGQDPNPSANPRGGEIPQYNQNPNLPNYTPPQGEIPGIPNNIPRYNPTPQQQKQSDKDKDDDDDGDN